MKILQYIQKQSSVGREKYVIPQNFQKRVTLKEMGRSVDYLDNLFLVHAETPVILAIHGNPTSSYLWRGILTHSELKYRVIAPNLQAGQQEEEVEILEQFLAALNIQKVVILAHDWGVTLGMSLMVRKKISLSGFAFCEGLMFPVKWQQYDFLPWALCQLGKMPFVGTFLLVNLNFFVRVLLPYGCIYKMHEEDLNYYLHYYQDHNKRHLINSWVKSIPTRNSDTHYSSLTKMTSQVLASTIPKLFFYATPGLAISQKSHEIIVQSSQNLTSINLGKGIHFLPEDYPREMANSLNTWLKQKIIGPF